MHRGKVLVLLTLALPAFSAGPPSPDEVSVKYQEGIAHGFLTLRTLEGKVIADGESLQTAKDGLVTARLYFRFKDGSTYEDTTTFSQRGKFRLLTDHIVQNGPAF